MTDCETQVEACHTVSTKLICLIYYRAGWIFPQWLVQQNLILWEKNIQVLQCFSIQGIHFLPSEIHLWSDRKNKHQLCYIHTQKNIRQRTSWGPKKEESSISRIFPRCMLGLMNKLKCSMALNTIWYLGSSRINPAQIQTQCQIP